MEWKALEKIDGPSGAERIDYLAAQIAATLVFYQIRRVNENTTVKDLVAEFLLELPWTPKPPPKPRKRKR